MSPLSRPRSASILLRLPLRVPSGGLFGIAATFTLLNAVIALTAWRSSGALLGILCHFLIAGVTATLAFVWAIAFFWILHWLNFWILLVLFFFIEAKRREPVYVRYTL